MQLHHVTIIVSDLEIAARFYEDVLGLERERRPDLGFQGLFYALGDGQQLHLMQIENPYAGCKQPEHGGRDYHFALLTDDLEALIARLEGEGIDYSRSCSGRAAIFFRDPDGNAIEVVREVGR